MQFRTSALAGGLTIGLVLGMASVAEAKTYQTISPEQMMEVLNGAGGTVELDSTGGDTTVEGTVDGRNYQVYFYDCDGRGLTADAYPDSQCQGIEYRAYFEGYPKDSETINLFNDEHHYGTLWRDFEDDMALQMNVIVDGGVTDANLLAVFSKFREAMEDFEIFMKDR